MGRWEVGVLAVLAVALARPALAQQTGNDYVTRAEYERLKASYEELKKDLDEMRAAAAAGNAQETQGVIDELEGELKELKQRVDAVKPGTSNFLITGYGTAGFVAREGNDSTFVTTLNPIFLWRIQPRLLFEGELEMEIEDGATEIGLEYADMSYLVNDNVTAVAGLFLAPFGTFAERYHAGWINELPDAPLVFGHDGIAPTSLLGVQVRGVVPIASRKLEYALYLANGPSLVTDDPMEAGTLDFGASTDSNDQKSVGGRIGFLPAPGLDFGYSAMFSRVDPSASAVGAVDATLQALDAAWVHDSEALGGTVKVRGEWVWSEVDDAVYDASGALGFGPLPINGNDRNGGYAQVSYRPSKASSASLSKTEWIVRYDALDLPSSAPENVDERRWTLGLDYWLTPSVVAKVAYQFDDKDDPAGIEDDSNALLFGLAMGF